ncbi:cold-shock protein [Amycolatopsis vancoresmycina]|uniref:cold-shock protein n=1 Tax=Amycolatopsis vancoresmycina TaxID=208444 RepID=UPI001FD5BE8C|nr:cold shock domain-containing protein [Amycolatopsis vancoresmycina]
MRFDETRGYGFASPETGGDDVFIHVNDLSSDKRLLVAGATLEFEVGDGDRGLKASAVRILQSPAARQAGPGPGADDGLCDVLPTGEYRQEITEVLLGADPAITGAQIIRIRDELVRLALAHGWLED